MKWKMENWIDFAESSWHQNDGNREKICEVVGCSFVDFHQ